MVSVGGRQGGGKGSSGERGDRIGADVQDGAVRMGTMM
jgi:hypothetical protein